MTKYISLIFLFGLTYILIVPPFQVPDTRNHFARASQVASGEFIAQKTEYHTGGIIEKSIHEISPHFSFLSFDPDSKTSIDYIVDAFRVKFNTQNKTFYGFENTALFSPVPYLPAAASIWVSSALFDSVLLTLYIAEIATLLASVMLIGLAMRYLPCAQPLIFAFTILPMFMFTLASISADSISNAMALLFVCQVFSVIYYQKQINRVIFIPILLTAVGLALCKQTYSILFVSALLITPQHFKNIRGYFVYALTFSLVVSSTIIAWNLIAKEIYTPWNSTIGIDAVAQFQWIFENPKLFLTIVLNDLENHVSYYILMMGGLKLGWVDTDLPAIVIGLQLLILCVLAVLIVTKFRLTLWQHALCGIVIVIGIFLIELSIYVHTEPVGTKLIRSVHGRYFLFLFIFFLIQLISINIKLPARNSAINLLTVSSTVLFLTSIPVIIARYYLS